MMNKPYFKMRVLPTLISIVTVTFGLVACGASSTHSTTQRFPHVASTASTVRTAAPTGSSPTSKRHQKDSSDGDSDPDSNDDNTILDYGHAAGAADKRAITVLVERYYAAAAADNGNLACSLIFSPRTEVIQEAYGQAPGPPSLRGKTCGVVLSKLFRQLHKRMVADADTLKVTGVRLEPKTGYALLSLRGLSEPRSIPLHIEFGKWTINAMADSGMP